MIAIEDKSKCCGCTACYSICPMGAIEMAFDDEGFKYPQIDKVRCIECGLCDRVCPEVAPSDLGSKRFSTKYAIQNKHDESRYHSTAGGFFSIIAEYVIETLSGVVFAVGFDGVSIVHKEAHTIDALEEMRGSKYVQSNVGDVFASVKRYLQEERHVLFVGTPCQIHGLTKLISNSMRQHLITIDLMCLGVSSPVLYEKWILFLQDKYKDRVKRVLFRDKRYGYATANVRVCFEHRKYLEQTYDAKSLMKTFFTGYNMRPSCYDCAFRCVERVSDFTIGDFHTIGKISPRMDDDMGTTCVWAHSGKAKILMNTLNDKMRLELLEKNVSSTLGDKSKLTQMPEDRSKFFEDMNSLTYDYLVEKWAKNDFKGRLINTVRVVINKFPFRSIVFKAMKSIKTKNFLKHVEAIYARDGGGNHE